MLHIAGTDREERRWYILVYEAKKVVMYSIGRKG